MSSKEKNNKKLIIETPEAFPTLTKRVLNLDDFISKDPYAKKIGKFGVFLNDLKDRSVYKILLYDGKSKESENKTTPQKMREIRNKYLKKLVESNPFYFPKELGLDEYKKPSNSKVDKVNTLIKRLEEIAKKEKLNYDHSRKNGTNLQLSRKESVLDNKRKRAEDIYEEIDNKKKKNRKQKEKEENGDENNNIEDVEEHNGEVEYNEEEDYGCRDDDDGQNYNYSYEGGDEGGDY